MFSFSSNKQHEKGQGLVEYAIILSLVAIVVIGVMNVMGNKVCNTFNSIGNSLPGGGNSSGGTCGTASSGGQQSSPTQAAVIIGDAARVEYCAERPGWTGGVNWGFAGGHTWTNNGQTYTVTGAPFNCPYP